MLKQKHEGSEGKNIYRCQNPSCGKNTLFAHEDIGVTPMFMSCQGCGSRSVSSMYMDLNAEVHFHRIWYRPSFKQAKKLEKKYPGMMSHIMNGGLVDKPKKQK